METFSALLALWAGNSPVPGEFPVQRPVARSFDVFLDLPLNKRLRLVIWDAILPIIGHCNINGNVLQDLDSDYDIAMNSLGTVYIRWQAGGFVCIIWILNWSW